MIHHRLIFCHFLKSRDIQSDDTLFEWNDSPVITPVKVKTQRKLNLSQRQQINQTEPISFFIIERLQLCVLQPLLKLRVKT